MGESVSWAARSSLVIMALTAITVSGCIVSTRASYYAQHKQAGSYGAVQTWPTTLTEYETKTNASKFT